MTQTAQGSLRRISADEFVSRLKETASQSDALFAFFLGAGCSLSCQIPGTAELVSRWLKKLYGVRVPHVSGSPPDEWVKAEIANWNPLNSGGSYGQVIQELFLTPEERQREIDSLCNEKRPGFGYAVLAALMSSTGKYHGRFNIVLTTNFDDLLQDALIRFRRPKPLVIHHESLAGFIRPTRTRPLIVKVHGDHSLSPKNTQYETDQLEEAIQQRIRSVLHDRGLVFLGYGGNDISILRLLDGLPEEALPFGVFWVSGSEPAGAIEQWLKKRDAVWVSHRDFDTLMDKIGKAFGTFINPACERRNLIEGLLDAHEKMTTAEREGIPGVATAEVLKDADPVYFGRLATYADFLQDNLSPDYATADFYYNAITDGGDQDGEVLGNYADFLERRMGDHIRARQFYEKAIQLDPDGYRTLGNFAGFLEQQNEYDPARKYYERAARAADEGKQFDEAMEFWFKTYTLDCGNARLVALGRLKRLSRNGAKLRAEIEPDSLWAGEHKHPGRTWFKRLTRALKEGKGGLPSLKTWNEWRRA